MTRATYLYKFDELLLGAYRARLGKVQFHVSKVQLSLP